MCGLAGIARGSARDIDHRTLRRMAQAIQHRGPDDSGITTDGRVGLAHVRLSILDLKGGAQPMASEDGARAIAYNGEIFNFAQLRAELVAHGHQFRTRSDTEVVLHGYAQWGEDLPRHLNGQFAFAIHDRRAQSVFLARDRFGILPLYYAVRNGTLYFASEVKALFASGELEAGVDAEGLDQVFTFWAALPPRTPFRGVAALEPGCCATWRNDRLSVARYYSLDFLGAPEEPEAAVKRLDELMRSAVNLRRTADVPVGGYLSGGLDSGVVCTLAGQPDTGPLATFAVAFDDERFDESAFQGAAARHLGSAHHTLRITGAHIADVFPDVVGHAETPLIRTAPAPMYLLARLVRDAGIKVVLTGEGADESFLGYDLFKETVIRRFCLRRPESRMRPRLFDRLYSHERGGAPRGEFWARYFLDAGALTDPLFSHVPRFRLTSWIKEFYSYDFQASLRDFDAMDDLRGRLPQRFAAWSPMGRAAYLEMVTLLSPYLLSSQGDRMAMAHGVETRTPFLDHRLVEFAAMLPERSRLRGLREKEILRRWAATILPTEMTRRPKRAYRAPDTPPFFGAQAPEYVTALLQPDAIDRTGIFDARAVTGLVRRCRAGVATGTRESQALIGVLSTQIWHSRFMSALKPAATPIAAPTLDVS